MKRITDLIPWKRKKEMVPQQSLHPFQDRQQRLDDFFNRAFQDEWLVPGGLFDKSGLLPRLDVKEEKKKITVEAEMPGVESKDIDLSLDGRFLRIKAEKREEHSDSSKGFVRHERSYGYYDRTVELPADVDESKAEASYKRGVLKIELNKLKESETRRIKVKSR